MLNLELFKNIKNYKRFIIILEHLSKKILKI
jgi:hypothetical protein